MSCQRDNCHRSCLLMILSPEQRWQSPRTEPPRLQELRGTSVSSCLPCCSLPPVLTHTNKFNAMTKIGNTCIAIIAVESWQSHLSHSLTSSRTRTRALPPLTSSSCKPENRKRSQHAPSELSHRFSSMYNVKVPTDELHVEVQHDNLKRRLRAKVEVVERSVRLSSPLIVYDGMALVESSSLTVTGGKSKESCKRERTKKDV